MKQHSHIENELSAEAQASGKKEKNKPAKTKTDKEQEDVQKQTLGKDYWDRVADDVASGYENEKDENDILNIDQMPGDNERGDTPSE